jgi:phosphoribosyl 1,2-cyclic phosphodiesterase
MKFCCLSSGSKQNAFYIETDATAILVDAGIPYRKLIRFIEEIGRDISNVEAVFVTHEHLDHVRALDKIVEKRRIPLFIHEESWLSLQYPVHARDLRHIVDGKPIEWKDLVVTPFAVSHDAAHTLGFRITHKGRALFMATDIGSFTDEILELSKGANMIAIESNYDHQMLIDSFYPLALKKRIAGKNGHLSNRGSYEFLLKTITPETKNVYFLHLSENNNHPSHIEQLIADELTKRFRHVDFHIADRESPGELIDV